MQTRKVVPIFCDFSAQALIRGIAVFHQVIDLPGTVLTDQDREFLRMLVWRMQKELNRRPAEEFMT
jgi:hypothetical protein